MEDRISKGILFNKKVLQKLKYYQQVDESFSNAVNRFILSADNCSNTNAIDTQILLKLIPIFIIKELTVDLTPSEIARIQELTESL